MKFEFGPALSPQEKLPFMPTPESIAALENFEAIRGWQSKLLIFLAACEIKPASTIEIFVRNSEEQMGVERVFGDLDLQFVIAKEERSKPLKDGTQDILLYYIVAHKSENLKRALDAVHNFSNPEKVDAEKEFGLAMGFPETSVEAYQQARSRGLRQTPDSPVLERKDYHAMLTPEENEFTFFVLSRDHYKEELKWVHKIIEITQKYAPKIYHGSLGE